MKKTGELLLAVGISVALLSGCAGMQPLSNYARTGDTITIALGGSDTNALAPVLKKENLSVKITDSSANTYPVKVRNLFRLYSDPTSAYDVSADMPIGVTLEGSVAAHQSEWVAILDLVDPSNNSLLPLQPGSAKLSVISPEVNNWVDTSGYGWSWTNGNLTSIPIEILPGTGKPNPLNYMQYIGHHPLDSLEPQPQVLVKPTGIPSTLIGGGSFIFKFTNGDFVYPPRVVTATPDNNVQLASTLLDQGDGTSLITVLLTNPHGFNIDNSKYDVDYNNVLAKGVSLFRSLQFSITWSAFNETITDSNWQNSLSLVSAKYVDLNGNPISTLSPTLLKTR